jgi:epoxide hydrolase-like predicted phosphatase
MEKIQHVFFDVGGVLLLDYSGTNKWNEMKRDLGVTEENDAAFEHVWKKYEKLICIDCDVDTLIGDFKLALGITFPQGYSMLNDFVNRFEPNPSIWPVVESIKKMYSVGLLTNMYPRMLNAINAKHLLPDIEWDVVVDSSLVGYQKPDEKIYQLAEEMAGVAPESIFFVDNSAEHLVGAAKRGWQTLLYDTRNPVKSSQEVAQRLC